MTDFMVGSIVRVVKQPKDMNAHIEGEVGFIDSLHENGTHAGFTALRLNGELNGAGTVLLDCLVLETSPHWAAAKKLYDENSQKHFEESMARTERISARIAEVAKEYGLPLETVEAIHTKVEKIHNRAGWPE